MEEETAAASYEDPDSDWDGFEKILSELALADMASKAQLLQSLSSFLSDVATTISFSEEFHALSAWIGASPVFLGHKEVSRLHELVVRELKDQTYFLSELSWTDNKQLDEAADGNFSSLNIEIVSQTLRCCIRILPLVDCFDKSASLSSTRLLDGILEQLCHPTKLFHFLGLQASEGMHCRRLYQTSEGDEDRKCLEHTQQHEACNSTIFYVNSRHRKELICAILEVYMDELLLRPDLIARLVSSREDVCLLSAQEQMTCYVRHTEASLEAAFVHVLSSLHSVACPEASPGSRRKGFLVCNLSLPAGLILLEKFSRESVPAFFTEHIVRLLARVLNATAPPGFGLAEELRRSRRNAVKNCWAGGVDWSHCSQEVLPNWDLKDKILLTNALQSQSTLNFASSILERAMILYMRVSLASDTSSDDTGSDRYNTLEGSLLQFYLSKYSPLFDVLGESRMSKMTDVISGSGDIGIGHLKFYRDDFQSSLSEVLNTHGDLVEAGSGTIGFAGVCIHEDMGAGSTHIKGRKNVITEKDDSQDNFDLVAAVLQLMSCALNCIGREVCMLTWFPDAFGYQFLNTQAMPLSEFGAADFDKILQCVGLYLSLCLPSGKALCAMSDEQRYRRAGEDEFDSNPVVRGQEPLNVLVGQAIVYFTEILRCEVHKGAPDEVLERYFHLVESLVALMLALDEMNDSRKSAPEYGSVCDCTPVDDICRTPLERFGYGKCRRCSPWLNGQELPKADNTSSYLPEMILSLKGVLHDLSLQQRSMPELSAALSNLLEGKQLAGSQWSLYFSETKQDSLGFESHCDLEINSTEAVPGCDHMDGQQTEFQSTFSVVALQDTVVNESQDYARTPASDMVLKGDQNLQIEKDICIAGPNFPIIKDLSARKEEDIRRQSDDGPIMPTSETLVSSVVVTIEKRQTRSATSLTVQKLETEANGVDAASLQPTPEERKQFSSATCAIIKRLLQNRSLPPRKSTKMRPAGVNELISEMEETLGQNRSSSEFLNDLIVDGDSLKLSNTNLYVDSLSELDPSKGNFDDLKDFIVPKKGRDYSKWFKRRKKARRRLYSKNFFKRLHEKKELLLLLDI